MKTKSLFLSALLFSGLIPPAAWSSISLDTESPILNNPYPQSTGVSLVLSDVMRNSDDDQNKQSHLDAGSSQHEILDLDHVPSDEDENDLKRCVVTGTAGPMGGMLSLEEIRGGQKYNFKLWKDPFKREVLTARAWDVWPNSTRQVEFYLEGYEVSYARKDIEMRAEMSCPGGMI